MGEASSERVVRARPLSPHLQIYRPMLTMIVSITNRVTGAMLYFGMALLAAWLVAAARGPEAFASIEADYGFTFALMFHTLAGIRHLVWDLGKGLDLRSIEWGAVAVVAGSIVLTLLLWLVILLRAHAA